MSREIKFRAWDNAENSIYDSGENSRMSYFGPEYWINDDGWIRFESPFGKAPMGDHNQERFTLMQYTGLKDKNGKPIYEGDVIRYWDKTERINDGLGIVALVEWSEPWLKWVTKRVGETYHGDQFDWELGFCEECEVIGNIYENPELLKGGEIKEL